MTENLDPSRRQFLASVAAAMSTAALFGASEIAAARPPELRDLLALRPPGSEPEPPPDPSPTPDPDPYPEPLPPQTTDRSPGLRGTYPVRRVILGEDASVMERALPQYLTLNGYPGFPSYFFAFQNHCSDGTIVGPQLPPKIRAAVYYPYSFQANKSNPLGIFPGQFPVMIYAHSYRDPLGTACGGSHPSTRDFTGADAMLRHVASYGCIAIAPDLSWIPGGFSPGSFENMRYAIDLRADVLVAYYLHLKALNSELFAQRLDLSRIVMAGHSTGGPGCVKAGIFLRKTASVSFGLIAPIPLPYLVVPGDKTLVLKGTLDTLQGADPDQNYLWSGPRKTMVTIGGANHFGYTDLCPPNNHAADVGLYDQNGTIPRNAQQLAGAAYLAALMRYFAQGDETARPYLNGEKQILELANAGAAGIQVISQGLS